MIINGVWAINVPRWIAHGKEQIASSSHRSLPGRSAPSTLNQGGWLHIVPKPIAIDDDNIMGDCFGQNQSFNETNRKKHDSGKAFGTRSQRKNAKEAKKKDITSFVSFLSIVSIASYLNNRRKAWHFSAFLQQKNWYGIYITQVGNT